MGRHEGTWGQHFIAQLNVYKMASVIIYYLHSYLKVATYKLCIFPLQHKIVTRL